jgi:hypothetical protein
MNSLEEKLVSNFPLKKKVVSVEYLLETLRIVDETVGSASFAMMSIIE